MLTSSPLAPERAEVAWKLIEYFVSAPAAADGSSMTTLRPVTDVAIAAGASASVTSRVSRSGARSRILVRDGSGGMSSGGRECRPRPPNGADAANLPVRGVERPPGDTG